VANFTFTVEELKSAPIEVRRWVVGRVESDLMGLVSAAPPAPPLPVEAPAACTPDEAIGVLELLKDDYAATHVFLELARDTPESGIFAPLHAINIAALISNTRLDDHRLVSCLRTINRAFQTVRQDGEATLFGFDRANHVYVHETTHRSIRRLWQELVAPHAPAEASATQPVIWPPAGFHPRQLGPSEDIATHQRH